jgi:hypothetical protein
MKRIILLLVVAACLVAAPAALAGGPAPCAPGDGDHPGWFDFGLVGSVSTVDLASGVLTVAVEHGSDGLPGTLDVVVNGDTCLVREQHHERIAIALKDIVAGDEVAIFGSVDGSGDVTVYTAAVVCVRVPSFCLVGTVTAKDVGKGVLSVAIDEASGGLSGTVDVLVSADTRIVKSDHARRCDDGLTLADVAVGDSVGVWGTIDTSGGSAVYTADRVCVRVPRFGLVGSVTKLDAENGVLSVAVDHGSAGLSGTVDVLVTADTELRSIGDHQCTEITLADVHVGDEVAAFGTVDKGTGTAVYTAHVVLDGVSADWLPRPHCRPQDDEVDAADAQRGDRLKVHLRVADAMPGCATARVTVRLKTATGRTVASRTVAAVAVNRAVTVTLKLGKTLHRGAYRLVTISTDWAGNRQAHARTAVLKVK